MVVRYFGKLYFYNGEESHGQLRLVACWDRGIVVYANRSNVKF